MEITRQADYAVRIILDLTLHSTEARVSSEDIARRQDIPSAFLSKIIARLAAEDLIQTQRGVKGGIRLARPADQITLLQVVEAIDGPITFNRCNQRPSECSRDRTCAVHPVWLELCTEFRARLSGYNFAAIAGRAQVGSSPAAPVTLQLFEAWPITRVPTRETGD